MGTVILRKMAKLVIKEQQMKAVRDLVPSIGERFGHQSDFEKRGMALFIINF